LGGSVIIGRFVASNLAGEIADLPRDLRASVSLLTNADSGHNLDESLAFALIAKRTISR
jgi:hypothetical protein